MEIEKQTTASEIRVTPVGEVTLGGVQQLQAELRECLAGGSPLVVDLGHVTEIDLAGLQLLVATARSFAALQQPLTMLRGKCVAQAWAEAGFPRGEVSDGKDNHDGG